MKSEEQHNVDALIDFVWPSISLSQKRVSSANRLLESLMVIGISITITTISLGVRIEQDRPMLALLPATLALLIALWVGYRGRAKKNSEVLIPSLTEMLQLTNQGRRCFRREVVETAGACVDFNDEKAETKHKHAAYMGAIYLLEGFCLGLWLIGFDLADFISSLWNCFF